MHPNNTSIQVTGCHAEVGIGDSPPAENAGAGSETWRLQPTSQSILGWTCEKSSVPVCRANAVWWWTWNTVEFYGHKQGQKSWSVAKWFEMQRLQCGSCCVSRCRRLADGVGYLRGDTMVLSCQLEVSFVWLATPLEELSSSKNVEEKRQPETRSISKQHRNLVDTSTDVDRHSILVWYQRKATKHNTQCTVIYMHAYIHRSHIDKQINRYIEESHTHRDT